MSIVKAKQKEYHARVPNETARDKNLSLKAKGLLCVLLSLDTDWKIYKSQIADFSSDKRDSVASAFNELIDKGYIIDKGRARNEKGHLSENLYEVYAEKPCLNEIKPITDFPTLENPTLENPSLSKYTITSNSISKSEKENQEVNLNTELHSDGASDEIKKEMSDNEKAEFYIRKFNKTVLVGGKERSFKCNKKIVSSLRQRIKDKYTLKDIMAAIKCAMSQEYHISNNYKYLTPEFFLRIDKLEMYLNMESSSSKEDNTNGLTMVY